MIGVYRSAALSIDHHNFTQFSTKEFDLKDVFEKHEIDVVIHTATSYKVNEAEGLTSLIDSNLTLPLRLLTLSSEYGVKLFVNTDTFSSDYLGYNYLQEYNLSKSQIRNWLPRFAELHNFKIINMKLFHMYGENDKDSKFVNSIIHKMASNEAQIELTDGSQTRDFIYVNDVVKAYDTILNTYTTLSNFAEFELGSGVGTTIREFVTKAHAVLGSKSELLFGKLPQRANEIESAVSDASTLMELGWAPETSLTDGINLIYNEFNSSNSYL